MRIVQITPGSGDSFYCENCLRDVAMVTAMRKLGHDVVMVPLYLPVPIGKDQSVGNAPIFFGGVNVYLQQKFNFFRRTPRWVDRVFDSRRLLGWVGRRAGMTSSRELGRTTISMLRGEQGRQIKELNRLVQWLRTEENQADLICLSNVLLVGLARRIKQELSAPVVCFLQDEDGFLDGLASPYSEQAWEILAERSKDVDAFVAVSKHYAGVMQDRLGLESDRVHAVYVGISLDGYEPRREQPEAPTIGFLSQMCAAKGLDTLVDAFIALKQNEKLANVRLRIAGGYSVSDKEFVNRVRGRLDSHGLTDEVEFLTGFDRGSKLAFLQSLSVLSVPEKRPVSYGLYVLETLAAGVPVVSPRSGVFPELLEMTGGGILHEPNDAAALAGAIERLLLDADYAEELGQMGRETVFEKFDIEKTAGDLLRIYEGIIRRYSGVRDA